MSALPKIVTINEEGPREGFQFEKGPISTKDKIALIDALSKTGLKHIQIASFVTPQRVPGLADADERARGIPPQQLGQASCRERGGPYVEMTVFTVLLQHK